MAISRKSKGVAVKSEAKKEEKRIKGLKRKKEERKQQRKETNSKRKKGGNGLSATSSSRAEEDSDVEVTREDEEFFTSRGGHGALSVFNEKDFEIKKVKDIKLEKKRQRQLKENLHKRKNIYDSDYEESDVDEDKNYENENESEEIISSEEEDDEEKEAYEKKHREWKDKPSEEFSGLPVKSSDGSVSFNRRPVGEVARSAEEEMTEEEMGEDENLDEEDAVDVVNAGPDSEDEKNDEEDVCEGNSTIGKNMAHRTVLEDMVKESTSEEGMTYEMLAARRKVHIHKSKEKLAELAEMVLENPQENYGQLKQFRKLILSPDEDVSVVKLGMATMLAVLKDVLPDYRIRVVTDKEKEMKVSKEVKQLREFEEGLLRQYQLYLQAMDNCVQNFRAFVKSKEKRKRKNRRYEESDEQISQYKYLRTVSFVAAKCLCELLVSRPEFNYRLNIITTLVPLMNMESEPKLSDVVCEAMGSLFANDVLGKATCEAVTLMSRTIKALSYRANPAMVDVFNRIQFKADLLQETKEINPVNNARSQPKQYLSKKKRKMKKEEKALEFEMQEASAQHNMKERRRNMTETVKMVFLTYFRILKNANQSVLLPTVLKGLAKNAHLINIDFFQDLMEVLKKVIVNENLGRYSSLNCISTAFSIVSGQGESLNIEMNHFYSAFYKVLGDFRNPSREEVDTLTRCFTMMLRNRKMFSAERTSAFIKRIAQCCLGMDPNGVLCLLAVVWRMIKGCSKTAILFENDTNGFGVYRPDLDDPEIANALNSTIWELNILCKHYHPIVRDCVKYILKHVDADDLRPSDSAHTDFILSRKTPHELLVEYDSSSGGFNPSIKPPGVNPLQRALAKLEKQDSKKVLRHVFLPKRKGDVKCEQLRAIMGECGRSGKRIDVEGAGEIEDAGCGDFFKNLKESTERENLKYEISKIKYLMSLYQSHQKRKNAGSN